MSLLDFQFDFEVDFEEDEDNEIFRREESEYENIYYPRCIFCSWPVNRKTDEKFINKLIEFLKTKNVENKIIKSIQFLANRPICRYDLWEYLMNIIDDKKILKDIKKFFKLYDFGGAMIT